MKTQTLIAVAIPLFASSASFGGVVIHNSYASWSAAVGGGDAVIGFDLGSSQDVFDQYSGLGVHFDGTALALTSTSMTTDGWAATSLFPTYAMTLSYDSPQCGIGLDLISIFKIALYAGDNLIYQSGQLNNFGPVFRGLSSDISFDKVVIQALPGTNPGSVDNIYVSDPIPTPATILVVAGLGLTATRGRRRLGETQSPPRPVVSLPPCQLDHAVSRPSSSP